MSIIIGSARIDENGKAKNGKAGDQKQKNTPDYSGEVSQQIFYKHKKGWYVLRFKKAAYAENAAKSMIRACNNPHIGYDQNNRLNVLKYGTDAKKDTECDCSSLVRLCVKEATGKDPGNFTTYNETSVLCATGLFDKYSYSDGMKLYTGDILVTKTQGHTVIVTYGYDRTAKKASKTASKAAVAKFYDKTLSGSYTATGSVHMRVNAGTTYDIITTLKKGYKVQNYGYYNKSGKNVWLYVDYDGTTGYVSKRYLKKV